MQKYKFSQLRREVIFKGYNRKCFYCEETFSTMGDMQIDHFLERNLLEKAEELQNLAKTLNLNPNFEIDSYYNFVPSHLGCHIRKHRNEYTDRRKAILLEEIASRVPELLKLEEKLQKDKLKTHILNELKRKVELGFISIEEIETIISDFHRDNIISSKDYEDFKRKINLAMLKLLKPNFKNFVNSPQFSRLEIIILVIFIFSLAILFNLLNINLLAIIPIVSISFLIVSYNKFKNWKKKAKIMYSTFKKFADWTVCS